MRIAPLSWRAAAVPLVLVLALLVTSFPVVHAHDHDLSLYNEECPLARLATPPTVALVDVSPVHSALDQAPDAPPALRPPAPAAAPLDSHGPRAPPDPDPVPA
jgi:hypothetical protein